MPTIEIPGGKFSAATSKITALEWPNPGGDWVVRLTWRYRASIDALWQLDIYAPRDVTGDFPLSDTNSTWSGDFPTDGTNGGSDLASVFNRTSDTTITDQCANSWVHATGSTLLQIFRFDGTGAAPPAITHELPTELRLGSGPDAILTLQSVTCDTYFGALNQHQLFGEYSE